MGLVNPEELLRRGQCTPEEAAWLQQVIDLCVPCPPPDVYAGMDLCPRHPGHGWPCLATRTAWFVKGLDEKTEIRRALDALPKPNDYYEEW